MHGRLSWVLSAVVVALVVQAFVIASSAVALDRTPDRTWMTNGKVYAMALSDNERTLYIGGKFTQIREKPVGTPGKIHHVNNVAAIHATGRRAGKPVTGWDPPEVTGAEATVYSLALEGGQLFIGGNFAAVGNSPRQNLAAVEARSGAVLHFAPKMGEASSIVETLLADGPRLYAGGDFEQVEEEGSATPVARTRLAAFDLDFATGNGALDPAWDPGANNRVRDLEFSVDKNSIFVAGAFNKVTGSDGVEEDRHSVARLFATGTATGNLHPWNPSALIEHQQTAWDVTVDDTKLYGAFGREQNYTAAFRLGSDSQAWKFGTAGNSHAVALSANGERLYFGGHFGIATRDQRVCSGRFLRGLGSLDAGSGTIGCGWLPSVNGPRPNYIGIRDMAVTDSHLWVGGGFTGISGVEQRNLAGFRL